MIIFREIKKLKFYNFFLFCVFFNTQIFAGILDYDFASYYGQTGNWDKAKDKLKNVFVDRSNNPNVLYDLAVACFNTKDFEHAAQYFGAVADSKEASEKLKEQAYFNLGNTNVKLKSLQDAIGNYKQVLKINSENMHAKHNLEMVEKMLEQNNKQENKKNNKDKQDQNKQEEQDNKQENKNQDQKKEEKEQDKNKQDKKNGKENKKLDEQKKSDKQGDNDQAENGSENKRENKGQQNKGQDKNSSNNTGDKQGSEGKGEKDSKNKKESKQNSGQEGNGQDHDKKPEQNGEQKQNTNHDKNDKIENGKDQEKQNGQGVDGNYELSSEILPKDGAAKLDERTGKILRSIDEFDKKNSKEFMKASVEKKMIGKYGQNLW
ncbi:MAG: hypothetical protein UR12_C0010G0039 [candidate division TM6 bacterium GW2011_GWF2_30_66]|jgi:Ca-activated chloride channel family protein|nr:MAG: hypothetical protein UR12_C0010G0039 [candidate division TM6 bacterium GW2011_GWF2_30_66]